MAKIALGTWAWGAGAFGGDAVFGSKTDEPELAPYKEMILHKNAELLFGK